MIASGTSHLACTLSARANTSSVVTPPDSALTSASCITGPSAIGSENGMPSSTRSAPSSAMATTSSSVVPRSGSPTVTNGMKAFLANTSRRSVMDVPPPVPGDRRHVLVPAAGEVHDHHIVLGHCWCQLPRVCHRVCALYRWDYALGPRQVLEGVHGAVVGDRHILRPAQGLEVRVLRADAGVVQPRRYRVHRGDLPVAVLAEERLHPVEYPRGALGHGRGVHVRVHPLARGLAPYHADAGVVDELVEQPYGVAPAAHACQEAVRPAPLGLGQLGADLPADYALEVADHRGIRMGPHDRPDDVVGVLDAPGPLPEGLVDRVLEHPGARRHRVHLGPQELHPVDVEGLPLDVPRAHVDLALQPEVGR